MSRFQAFALGMILAAGLAAPTAAVAATQPSTRLVECGAASCLLVTGHRDDAKSNISINGHAVSVEGGRKWRARVPVETVRAWSTPYARTIEVSVDGALEDADLPIGLLGHAGDLAMLIVRVK